MARTKRMVWFQVRRPSKKAGAGKRRSYAIQRIKYDKEGTRSFTQVDDPRIAAVNKALEDGKSIEQCEQLIQEILASLNAEQKRLSPKIVHNSENQALRDAYWEKEYAGRDISAPEVMGWELDRALDAVGELSLVSTSREELQKALARKFSGNKQRKIADRINALLKFAGRTDRLRKDRKERKSIKYVSIEELQKILPKLPSDEYRLLVRLAFGTGMRVGEIFAVTPERVRKDMVLVEEQLDKKLKARDTKTRRTRKAYIIPDAVSAFKKWFALPDETRLEFRKENHAEMFREACEAAFPKNSAKHLVVRDLRHSYAIHLVRHGVSITLVAQSLGNSVAVCQEYYAGFALVDESIDTIRNIMNKST